MKILLVNKFHFPKGGADTYYLRLGELLQKNGHEVAHFAMAHPKNLYSAYQRYFVSQVDFSQVQWNYSGLKNIVRMIWSREAATKFRKLLLDFKPDVVHVHNIYHQISPSILKECKKKHIPVVMTVHDYNLISPNYGLFSHGQIDESTKKYKYYNAIMRKSVKNSYVASFLAAIRAYIHKYLQIYENMLDLFVAPSQFMKLKLAEYGMDETAITVLPNPVHIPPQPSIKENSVKPYFLFAGRLSEEKGIKQLVEAFKNLSYTLKIAGAGDAVLNQNTENIEFLGFQNKESLEKLAAGARAVIVPSVCYENCPLSILEAYAQATPVIASDIGGIPELVNDGETGYLIPANDTESIKAAAIQLMEMSEEDYEIMKQKSFKKAQEEYTEELHYRRLIDIYNHVK